MADLIRGVVLTFLWHVENMAATHHWLHAAATACHLAVTLGAYGPCLR